MTDERRPISIGQPIPQPRAGRELSDEELLRLIEGTLTEEQRRRLEARLAECPYSADRVAIVRQALEEAGVRLPALWLVRDEE